MTLRRRLHAVLEATPEGERAGRIASAGLMTLIGLNVVALTLESVSAVRAWSPTFFDGFESFSVAVFSVEYALRLWACVEDERYRGALGGRLRFALTPLPLIDLLAIVPFYLPMLPLDLRALRALRLMRVFRLLKVLRYSQSLMLLGRVFHIRRSDLIVTLTACLLLLIVSSTLVYFIERDAQPAAFSSIPAALWWGICTLTTVGYGDIYPVTDAGRLVAAFISMLAVGLFALPAGVLASGYAEVLRDVRTAAARGAAAGERHVCPHCGKDVGRA
jgi:voltage-gated potassium channel